MKLNFAFLALLVLCNLQGCGFHLRGYTPIAPELRALYLQIGQPYSALAVQLRRGLNSMGIVLIPSIDHAPVVLNIVADNLNQQLTAISANTQVRTYVLTYTITFQLEAPAGVVILPAQTVSVVRSYETSVIQTLGDRDVLNTVQEEMRRDAIGQIINRLNAQHSRCILSEHVPKHC